MLPRVVKHFAVSVDGRGYAGRADEVKLPDIALKTEEFRAGGMDGPVQIDMGMEALECEITFAEHDKNVVALFGQADMTYTIRGAIQDYWGVLGADAVPVLIRFVGRCKKVNPGVLKPGDRGSVTLTIAITRFGYVINNELALYIDMENGIRVVDGKDQLATVRKTLKL